MQGFATGCQYGAAATYLSEIAEPGRRGFYASFQFVTLIGGQLLALLVIFGLQASMSEAAIRDWGWRLPFLLGAVLAGALLLLPALMHATAEPAGDCEEAGWGKGMARRCLSMAQAHASQCRAPGPPPTPK